MGNSSKNAVLENSQISLYATTIRNNKGKTRQISHLILTTTKLQSKRKIVDKKMKNFNQIGLMASNHSVGSIFLKKVGLHSIYIHIYYFKKMIKINICTQ